MKSRAGVSLAQRGNGWCEFLRTAFAAGFEPLRDKRSRQPALREAEYGE
ncbi:MAG: hypothetical protein IJS17_06490 [Clostridia bacterium]|nr:hypothetical protein [Clostridia bacterium]